MNFETTQADTQQFSQALRRISAATYAVRDTHSFACGYLESLAASMFANMTKKQRKEFLEQVTESAVKYETLAEVAGVESR